MGGLLSTTLKVDVPTIYHVESKTLGYVADVLSSALALALRSLFEILRMALTKVRGLILGAAVVMYAGVMGLMLRPLFFLQDSSCTPGKDWYARS